MRRLYIICKQICVATCYYRKEKLFVDQEKERKHMRKKYSFSIITRTSFTFK